MASAHPTGETDLLLIRGRVITATGTLTDGWVHISRGRIQQIGNGEPVRAASRNTRTVDVQGAWVGPGFIDVHVHGGGGYEVMDAAPHSLVGLATFLARHGVTSFLPTTFTASAGETLAALEHIARHLGPVPGGARVLGAHMEGPYLSEFRRGAHRKEFLQHPDTAQMGTYLATGVVRKVTLAPELEGAAGLIQQLREHQITVSAGHTDATYDQTRQAAAAGVRQVTHIFNAMRGLHHREPGAAGAALALDTMSCEVIADGVHLDPAVLRLIHRAKGTAAVILVSDAGKAAGLPEGRYQRAGRTMVAQDGALRLPDGTLGGSTGTLDASLRNYCAATGLSLDQAWCTVSTNPAKSIGIADRTGTIAIGKDADLTVLSAEGHVQMTIAGGHLAHP
ncbi:MAG TPA: N-acetylglucosamine-6-phosphate deacetylase [Beutenbergiaceae bacterium]|nr:N-acetylglucosamine-6-phosphate deacetylase [Beutenbergiaceae bacterium]